MRVFRITNESTDEESCVVAPNGEKPVHLRHGESHAFKMANAGALHIFPILEDTPALFAEDGTVYFEGHTEE